MPGCQPPERCHGAPERVDVPEIARLEPHVATTGLQFRRERLSVLDVEVQESDFRALAGKSTHDLHPDA